MYFGCENKEVTLSILFNFRFAGAGTKAADEVIPACIECQTKKYVVRERTTEKIATAAGGVLGAAAAYLSESKEGIGAFAGVLLGLLTGSAAGNMLGERFDCKIRMKYRCRKCGASIHG